MDAAAKFKKGFFWGILTALVVEAATLTLVGVIIKREQVSHGCAHYDAKTGGFTWNNEVTK